MRNKIGECLVQAGLISAADLEHALVEQKRTGERLGVVLVRLNLATERQIASALALQLGFPYISLAENTPDPAAVVLIPKEVALKRACIAVDVDKDLLTVAMADPLMFSLVHDLELQTGRRIIQVVATRADILDAIETCYPDRSPAPLTSLPSTTTGLEATTEAAPIDVVDLIVKSAVESKASDIHIEPTENGVLVRYRLDGHLKEVMDLPTSVHDRLIARLKGMAGMDIAEKRLPQDGRLRFAADDGPETTFRVFTQRMLFGEKVVMRVLGHREGVPALEEIGMSTTALENFQRVLAFDHGMILVVGPPGSGRSTTLSSALRSVRSEKANITTIENPVEYTIPGVNQTQIDEQIGLTFASALRSILQQDPDVILVGEIQDAETAKIAIQGAKTGHLVLSTLQTDDAPSAVTRLMDIGIEPNDIAGALLAVIAQRLVRRLCVHCRRQYTPLPETLRALTVTEAEAVTVPFYRSVGCDQCYYTGYRGRIGIYEVMCIDDRVRGLISSCAPADQIREAAIAGGMTSLGEDGLAKVKSGVTTLEEVLRVVADIGEIRTLCSACGAAVGVDFNACPSCGKRLGDRCSHCGRALQPGWNFCPYCARGTTGPRRARRFRDRERPEGRDRPRGLPPGNIADFKK